MAVVMPASTTHHLNRAAKVMAMSCDLSPSSATNTTAKLIRTALSTANLPKDLCHTDPTFGPRKWHKGLAHRIEVRFARPGWRQYVDHAIGGYLRAPPTVPGGARIYKWELSFGSLTGFFIRLVRRFRDPGSDGAGLPFRRVQAVDVRDQPPALVIQRDDVRREDVAAPGRLDALPRGSRCPREDPAAGGGLVAGDGDRG
ncbi:hypothetical protein [Tsukamurella sp. PLM1]|uniref:hypothetical protein n=1 Tax=Tsukamurella sp. PLM1 TaxID=2929795 RepID=UPI0020BEE024|nr:hypothetical protein [Tsukamurella sp. PLM1]